MNFIDRLFTFLGSQVGLAVACKQIGSYKTAGGLIILLGMMIYFISWTTDIYQDYRNEN